MKMSENGFKKEHCNLAEFTENVADNRTLVPSNLL